MSEAEVHRPFVDRLGRDAVILLLQKVHDKVEGMDKMLSDHISDEPLVLAEEIAKLMNRSFPQGDPEGHRAYHEASIRAAKDRADFWAKMKFEISKWGLLGFLGWAIGVVVMAVWKTHFGK